MLQVCPSRATPVQMPSPTSITVHSFWYCFNLSTCFFCPGTSLSEFPGIHIPQDPWDWYIHLPIYHQKSTIDAYRWICHSHGSIVGRICLFFFKAMSLSLLQPTHLFIAKNHVLRIACPFPARNSSDPLWDWRGPVKQQGLREWQGVASLGRWRVNSPGEGAGKKGSWAKAPTKEVVCEPIVGKMEWHGDPPLRSYLGFVWGDFWRISTMWFDSFCTTIWENFLELFPSIKSKSKIIQQWPVTPREIFAVF